MNTHKRPEPAADLVAWAIVLGAIAVVLFAWGASVAEPASSYTSSSGPSFFVICGSLLAVGSMICGAVGVHRLVTHADHAALRGYERSEEGRGGDKDRDDARPWDAPRSDVGPQ